MQVREIMAPIAAPVRPEWPLRKVADHMRLTGLDCLPVADSEHTIGMITEHDIACRTLADAGDPATVKARQIMSGDPCRCFDDDEVEAAWRKMEALHSRRLIVVDHADHAVGVLRLGDLARGNGALTVQAFVDAYLDYHR